MLDPGAHGGDVVAVATALGVAPRDLLDLSASLNPVAPDVTALAGEHLDALHRYPDPAESEAATDALASAIGVEPARVLLTNGAAEAIALVAAENPSGWVEAPEFSLYERHLTHLDLAAGRWRSNPNNPLGTLAPAGARAAVWDESFWPLAVGTWTRGDDDAYRIGSLTKLWSCAGLRLGYVIAPSAEQRDALARRQPAWSVSTLALAIIRPMLAATDLPAWKSRIAALRSSLADVFGGFDVTESAANWVLVHDAAALRAPLARRGVLVRDCANFGLDGTIRVAVPDERGLERLAGALADAMNVTPTIKT
jgi:histidinol-phosphate/aromatic aminotransferase/cobyric acid decarboxylase-like protein